MNAYQMAELLEQFSTIAPVMVDEHQRHEDAIRDEPPASASQEEWITSRLKTYLRGPAMERRTTREETATGRSLSRFFTETNDGLTPMQWMILWWQYGPDDLTIAEIARRLHLHDVTVERQRHAALEYLIRVCFDEPTSVLPHWTSARAAVAED